MLTLTLLAQAALAQPGDIAEIAARLMLLSESASGEVIAQSPDRELLRDLEALLSEEAADVRLERSGWSPEVDSVSESDCGLWFAQTSEGWSIELLGTCPEITPSAVAARQESLPAADSSDDSSDDRRKSQISLSKPQNSSAGKDLQKLQARHDSYTNSLLIGMNTWEEPTFSWRGLRQGPLHFGVDLMLEGQGPPLSLRSSLALSPFRENLAGLFIGPTFGAYGRDLAPGWTLGFRQPINPGFTLEVAMNNDFISSDGITSQFRRTLTGSMGFSFSGGEPPAYEPLTRTQRRAIVGVGGVVLVAGGALFTAAAVVLSGMPIGG